MADKLFNFLFPDLAQPETIDPTEYDSIAEREASRYGLDDRIVKSLISQESGGQAEAVSPKGAIGVMQIMPSTGQAIANELGEEFSIEKLQDPETNIRWGTYLLNRNKQLFGRDDLALAAYHGGPGAVQNDGTINPNSNDGIINTTDYVDSVLGRAQGIESKPAVDELSEFLGLGPLLRGEVKPEETVEAETKIETPVSTVEQEEPVSFDVTREIESPKPTATIEFEPIEVTPLSDADVYGGELLPTRKIAAGAHRIIGTAKKMIAPEISKTAFLHKKPTEKAITVEELKEEAKIHGKAAEYLDPTWYRSEKINEKIEKIQGQDPNLANAFKMGDISGAADINVTNAFLSGDETAKSIALNTAKKARETAGEFAKKKEHRKGVTGKAINVLESVSEMLPMLGKSAALNAVPGIGQAMSASMWAMQGAGDIITQLKDEDVGDDTALAYGLIGGMAYSLVEQVQIGRITNVGKKVVGESVRKKLISLAKEKGLDWVQNVREEVLQGVITENAILDAMKASGIEVDQKELHDRYIKAVKENFVGSAGPMAVLSLVGLGAGAGKIGFQTREDITPVIQEAPTMVSEAVEKTQPKIEVPELPGPELAERVQTEQEEQVEPEKKIKPEGIILEKPIEEEAPKIPEVSEKKVEKKPVPEATEKVVEEEVHAEIEPETTIVPAQLEKKPKKEPTEKKVRTEKIGRLGLHLTKNPSGKYSFVGSVPDELAFVLGSTKEEIEKGKQFGQRFGPKTRVFDNIEEAKSAAEKAGYQIDSFPKPEVKEPKVTPEEKQKEEEQVGGFKKDQKVKFGKQTGVVFGFEKTIGSTENDLVRVKLDTGKTPFVVVKPEDIKKVEQGKVEKPKETLPTKIETVLKEGKVDNKKLFNIADEHYGGTWQEGRYDPRDVYDATEEAMNRVITANPSAFANFKDSKKTLLNLLDLTDRLPRQTVRSTEQIELQQFSTPPGEAFVVAAISGIEKGMSVLEPSAGTGNIATMAKLKGGNVVVNEIAERRQENLKSLGFKVYDVDGEQLHNMLPDEVKPDVIVMNPPFSSTGGRVKTHKTKFGARHVEQALLRLNDGGRLVAIVGRGMAHNRPTFTKWWTDIENKYNVRANVGMSGKYYGKLGTTFDNQIIVIDKTGPTPGETRSEKINNIIIDDNLSPMRALEVLKPLSEENVYDRIKDVERKGEPPVEEKGGGEGEQAPAPGIAKTERGEPSVKTERKPERGEPTDVVEPAGRKPEAAGERPGKGVEEGEQKPAGRELAGIRERGGTADTGRIERVEGERARKLEEEESGVFAKYRVQKVIYANAKPHPANVVESAALASVEPPNPTYTPSLPKDVVEKGKLSDIQLETVTYAGQRHSQKLPDGSVPEYWIGDGTGIGKGREIAGIIYDNWNRGRKKAVWVSISKELFKDAQRDLDGIGMPAEMIRQGSLKLSDKITMKEGIVFTQYTTLRQDWGKTRARFKQLVDWLGKDFDGVIVFDEAHQMKNAQVVQFQEGKTTEGSDQGAMGVHLKATFPNARILNVSATGATHPTNLGYLSRMGLWGPGAPFSDFNQFLNAIGNGGVGAMEVLSRDLKAIGAYNSRSISYEGVDYGQVVHELTEDEIKLYDRVADLWSNIMQEFEKGMEAASMTRREASGMFAQFYSAQQRFFLQYMMALQLPDMITDAEQQLREGNSVVISLYNTNEQAVKSRVAQAIAEDIDLENINFSAKDMIESLIEKHFPVQQYQEKTDPLTGETIRVAVVDKAGNPVLNKENVARKEKLIETLIDYDLPGNPFDVVVNHFGPNKIAEISGRKERLENNKLVKRSGVPSKAVNDTETANFQSGKKRIAIISGAASTGISLHSDMNEKNQQRRVFYALQLSWSADQQMQSFGRVHRSFQKVAPEIKMVRTNLAGQQRLINTISKRLSSLGAVSSGTREAYTGSLFDIEDITDNYGQAALSSLFADKKITHALRQRMGLNDSKGNLKNGKDTDVEGFLNRIMALPFEDQNGLFEEFYERYTSLVEKAKEEGKFDTGVRKIEAEKLRESRPEETVYTHEQSGAKTQLVTLEGEVEVKKIKSDYAEKLAKSRTDYNVYYVTNNRSKRAMLIYRTDTDVQKSKATVLGTRGNTTKIDVSDISERYETMDQKEWKKEWDKQYKEIPDKETAEFNLITGAIFPIYEKIFSNTDFRTGIYKASTEQRDYIGVLIPNDQVIAVKQNLGIGAELAKLSPEQILGLIENNGSMVQLDNGWIVHKSTVRGKSIIKIDPKGKTISSSDIEMLGIDSYVIDYKRIYFIPVDKSTEVMEKILKQHKAIKDVTGGSQAYDAPPFKEPDTVKPSEALPIDQKGKTSEQLRLETTVDTARNSKATGSKKTQQIKAVDNLGKQIQHNPGGPKKGSGWLNPFEYGYFQAKEVAWPIIKMRPILQKIGVKKEKLLNDLDYTVDEVRSSQVIAQRYLQDYYDPIFDPLYKMKIREAGKFSRILSQYLVAKRTEWSYNNRKGYEDAGISLKDAETVVDYIESGDYSKSDLVMDMAKKIWEYTKTLKDIKLKAGIIDQELFENLRDPYYVPFFRDIDTGIHRPSAPMRLMFTATSTGIRRMKGSKSGHKIIDPLQLIVSSTHETITNAARVKVFRNVIALANEHSDIFGDLISKVPERWLKAPNIEHRIQVDIGLREQIDEIAKRIGVKIETAYKLGKRGVKGSKKRLGLFDSFNQEIRILYGATESTRAHELGHALDEKYPWIRDLLMQKHLNDETDAIAHSRYEGEEVPNKFVRYVNQPDEKVAEFISLYLSNRPMLKELAPMAFGEFERNLRTTDLKDLENIKPTNVKSMESYEEANYVLDKTLPRGDDIVGFLEKGKLQAYRVPIEMAMAIKNLHPAQIPTWLKWTFTVPKRSLVFTAVTGNPEFLVRNVPKDQFDIAHNTKSIPFVDWFIGAKHIIKGSELVKLAERAGYGSIAPELGLSGAQRGMGKRIYGSEHRQSLAPFKTPLLFQ